MRPTRPHHLGAPLDGDEQPPTVAAVQAEIDRAEIELMYAIAEHRKAWARMRLRLQERDALVDKPGGLAAIDSDPIWKKRTGDVAWWRDEMTAQATALAALEQMREKRIQRKVGPALNPSVRLGREA